MSSSTSPLPPPSPAANTSTLPTISNDDSDNDIGPVTKLAQIAAIEEQERKQTGSLYVLHDVFHTLNRFQMTL